MEREAARERVSDLGEVLLHVPVQINIHVRHHAPPPPLALRPLRPSCPETHRPTPAITPRTHHCTLMVMFPPPLRNINVPESLNWCVFEGCLYGGVIPAGLRLQRLPSLALYSHLLNHGGKGISQHKIHNEKYM